MNYRVLGLTAFAQSLLTLASVPSFASDYYSFGGGCASLGAWSQSALSQAQQIEQAVQKLKSNPKCKGIESISVGLDSAEKALTVPSSVKNRSELSESLPGEISALRTYIAGDSKFKNDVNALLVDKTLQSAALGPELATAEALDALKTKATQGFELGLTAMDQVLQTLPAYDECLIGMPDQGAALLGSTIKLAAAFVSSENGVMSRLGSSLSKLVTVLRDKKFSSVLRKLNESEFWLSMSCLMETTSQAYCSAKDAYDLLQNGKDELKFENLTGVQDGGNPLQGYLLYVREVPTISSWLQKIQFGVQPKLLTDANFKNDVWDTITNLTKKANMIRGDFSEEKLTLATLTDVTGKKNLVLQIVSDVTYLLTKNEGNQENFFTMSTMGSLIPFYLIGLDTIPPECATNNEGHVPMTWQMWMENGGKYQPQFDDPDALANTIEIRLSEIIDKAQEKASAYFRQRMIVDMSNLVDESLTSQTITVVDSLQHIFNYLDRLAQRIIDLKGDLAIIPSIRDTQVRIKKVLDSYETIRKLATISLADMEKDPSYSKQINDAYASIIETAYDSFNVLLQRDAFITTRMSTFVHQDFALRIQHKDNLSQYEKDILIVSGKNLLDGLSQTYGMNPAAVQVDLASAQVVNKRNLEAVEMLLSDSLVPTIVELGKVAQGKDASDWSLTGDSIWRLAVDSNMFLPGMLFKHLMHPDLYPIRLTDSQIRGSDDAYGSFDQFKAKLCVQTLAFENKEKFGEICQGSVLKSYFDTPTISTGLSVSYDQYLNNHAGSKVVIDADNICAFRNFNRRNLVYWLIHDPGQTSMEGGVL